MNTFISYAVGTVEKSTGHSYIFFIADEVIGIPPLFIPFFSPAPAGLFCFDLCAPETSYAPGFAADFPPEMSEFYQRTRRVRLKNSGTSGKKSPRKFRYNEIPRAH